MSARRFAGGVLAGSVIALASRTAAAAPNDHPLCQGTPRVVTGTVGYSTLQGAITTNALAFGAASLVERKLLPTTAKFPFVFHYDILNTYSAVRAPLCDEKTGAVKMSAVDLTSTAIGVAGRFGIVTLFLAGSGTLTAAGGKANERIGLLGGGLVGVFLAPAAPFKNRWDTNTGAVLTADLIVGADANVPHVGRVAAGYVASRGLYTNVSQQTVRVFGTAVLRSQLEDSPYLRAGISRLDWLFGSAEKTIGFISPYVRQTRLPASARASTPKDQLLDVGRDAKSQALRTLHLDRLGARDPFDLRASYAIAPTPQLYEISASLHTAGFLPEEYLLTSEAETSGGYEARLTAGAINLPDLYFYGVAGGWKPRVQLDLMAAGATGTSAGTMQRFFLTFGLNASDTLAVFPFAYNAFQVGISWNVVSK